MRDVSVDVSGHGILHGINLDIRPGTHVAIVGRSGAGKSTLLGLLLGWYRPSGGTLQVDGEDFEHLDLEALRRQTAWVDPTVRLWNQTIASNLTYGQDRVRSADLSQALAASELDSVLERLPEGLQTSAGEGGIRLSGGEGQRLRFARALLRKGVRLALLDEPFRGLDRGARRRLLERARRHWKGATLLCVTHDVCETRGFDEVLVIEEGRLLERGTPEELLAKSGSRYRALLLGDELAQRSVREGEGWRRWRVESGRVIE
jgi:ABC-type multidrug transport system fused ATPase/permease subunit